jgi:hypothetical protein
MKHPERVEQEARKPGSGDAVKRMRNSEAGKPEKTYSWVLGFGAGWFEQETLKPGAEQIAGAKRMFLHGFPASEFLIHPCPAPEIISGFPLHPPRLSPSLH